MHACMYARNPVAWNIARRSLEDVRRVIVESIEAKISVSGYISSVFGPTDTPSSLFIPEYRDILEIPSKPEGGYKCK